MYSHNFFCCQLLVSLAIQKKYRSVQGFATWILICVSSENLTLFLPFSGMIIWKSYAFSFVD